jgi:hypothetical protein
VNIYDKAIELLETNGWCQGEYKSEDGKLCMLGALFAARGDFSETWSAIYNDLGFCLDSNSSPGISFWNDTPGRTAAEVIDALKRASQLAKDHI